MLVTKLHMFSAQCYDFRWCRSMFVDMMMTSFKMCHKISKYLAHFRVLNLISHRAVTQLTWYAMITIGTWVEWSLALQLIEPPDKCHGNTFHREFNSVFELPHWSRVTYLCVSKFTIIVSDNDFSLGWPLAIIWTNVVISLLYPKMDEWCDIQANIVIAFKQFTREIWITLQVCSFQTDFSDWWLRHLFWNRHNMNVTGPHWWSVNIGVPSGNKQSPEPVLTQISVAILCH